MSCEQFLTRVSAQIDRELTGDEQAALEDHLRQCPDCVAAAEAFRLQDVDLRHAFTPRRQQVAERAEATVRRLPPTTIPLHRGRLMVRLAVAWSAAAAVAAVVLLWLAWRGGRSSISLDMPIAATQTQPTPTHPVHLVARPKPPAPEPAKLVEGETLQTAAGERRRVALPGGSILYVNQNTTLKLASQHHLQLDAGEVFLNTPPLGVANVLIVETAQRQLTTLAGKLDITVHGGQTGVTVAQGIVHDSHLAALIPPGSRVVPGANQSEPAPRASHVLDWTRDLMAAAESPLVPSSKFAGGALVAVDPYGQEARLSLRKYHIDVHVEDGFARTTIDQTYFNHATSRLEGTFYFPLPPDASLSRLAMYVDGTLMEGGMAERDHARQVYERIVRSMKDPALLEWVDGSTFKMRVFPLEARQEKRIILSYVQRLPVQYGRTSYRFPAGHTLDGVGQWSFAARVKGGARLRAESASHPAMKITRQGDDLVLADSARDIKADRDVVFDLHDADAPAEDVARFSAADHEGNRYLMLRYRPQLPGAVMTPRRDWVFLVETSADRDPLLARTQIEIIRSLLDYAGYEDTLAVLAAGTRVQAFNPAPVPVTPDNIAGALAFLESAHLIGALDLGKALDAAAPLLEQGANGHLVHVGGGYAALGEHRDAELFKRLPAKARYVGVGVGKRWNRAFMKTLAERSGGYVTQINPDEPVAWRGVELAATLAAPRLLDIKVVDNAERVAFLTDAASLAQGEELAAVARVVPGQPLPESLTISGTLDGQPYRREVRVEQVAGGADYLPRTWARLEIDRLLTDNAAANKPKIVELSKAMYVMTPFTSLLVLENEEMYRQYNVDRGRKDHWAMYPCPDKIPVVYEPLPGQHDTRAPQTAKPHRNQVMQTVVTRQGTSADAPCPGPSFESLNLRNRVYGSIRTFGRKLDHWGEWSQGDENGTPNELLRDLVDYPPAGGLVVRGLSRMHTNLGFAQSQHAGARQDLGRGETMLGRFNTNGMTNLYALSPDGRMSASGGLAGDYDWYSNTTGSFGGTNAVFFTQPQTRGANPVHLGNGAEPLQLGQAVIDSIHDGTSNELSWRRPALRTAGGREITSEGKGKRPLPEPAFLEMPFEFVNDFNSRDTVVGLQADGGITQGLDIPVLGKRSHLKRLASPAWFFRPAGAEPSLPVQWVMFERPQFNNDDHVFTDLTAYAPGLNTSRADLLAVLAAEAAPQLGDTPGQIDPAARKLLDKARAAGWQSVTLDGVTVGFDGAGRYAYERTLPLGLREQVICDGNTLLHLYAEIGLGARRSVSRFHRAALRSLVPWVVPPAEDLARGADLRLTGDNTVSLVPLGADKARDDEGKLLPYRRLDLLFTADGRLSERRLVAVPSGKALLRETYDDKGTVRILDSDGKELSKQERSLKPATEPNLRPDTAKLVVLPLPLRTRPVVYPPLDLDPNQQLETGANACYTYLDTDAAEKLFAAEWAANDAARMRQVFLNCFDAHGDRRLGFYTLMASAGVRFDDQPDFLAALRENPGRPLAHYLALVTNPVYRYFHRWAGMNGGDKVDDKDSFLRKLAVFRDRCLRWLPEGVCKASAVGWDKEVERGFAFVRQHKTSPLGLALLGLMQDRGGDKAFHQKLAEAWALFTSNAGLQYIARYEQAHNLLTAGRRDEARTRFRELYAETFKEGVLPPLDNHFRTALQSDGKDAELWDGLMRQTAAELIEKKQRPAAVTLAWQCYQLGDQPLAAALLAAALDGQGDDERLPTTLAAVEFLWQTGQHAPADTLLQTLLDEPRFAKHAVLWRLSEKLAEVRGMSGRALACLERALDREYQDLPEVINLESLRADYGKLLEYYRILATAAAGLKPDLKADPPADLVTRTVRAADRWRALDREPANACQAAATVLRLLGAEDLAWDYLTTPHATHRAESTAWYELAKSLSREGHLTLADRAYAAAFDAEPGNALMLWQRMENLRQAGHGEEAIHLLRRIAEGEWPQQHQAIKAQARRQMEGR